MDKCVTSISSTDSDRAQDTRPSALPHGQDMTAYYPRHPFLSTAFAAPRFRLDFRASAPYA